MSYYLDAPTPYMQDTGSYAIYADLCVGDNGSGNADPTYSLLNSAGDMNGDYYTWDNNTSDGFDTGNVQVAFGASSSGGASLSTDSSPSTGLSSACFNTVGSVDIIAGVQIPGEAQWSNINIAFLRNGVTEETLSIGSGPHVDTRATPNSPNQEQILVATPSHTDCNQVKVSGTIRMNTNPGVIPGPSDIFCDVAIIPAS